MKINADGFVTVTIRETGQTTDLVPDVARAMLASGYAVQNRPESMAAQPAGQRAVAPAQAGPSQKSPKGGRR